jgi:Rrf2 family nitric oxide-sensitive transcriptional repressor
LVRPVGAAERLRAEKKLAIPARFLYRPYRNGRTNPREMMRLALKTDYALRTLLFLATRTGRTKEADVAGFFGISAHHIGKVVHQLGRLGYVRNHRGPSGGIELARKPGAITVGRVVLDFEGDMHLLDCVGAPGHCVIQPGCTLRGVLTEAERLPMDYLNSITLEALLPSPLDLAIFQA